MSIDNNTKSTAERVEIDPIFKDVLTFNFGQLEIPIQTQVEISRLPRTMDALVYLSQPSELEKVRTKTAFSYFRAHNQIEFKGKNDLLTIFSYHLILGRAHLYLGEKETSALEMTVTIISARKPNKVLRHCQDDVRWEEVDVGHYVSKDLLPVHLIVSNEIGIEPKNYPLLLFAASEVKFRQFVEQIVGEDNSVYIYYAYRINPKLTKKVLEMAGKLSSYRKNLEFIANDIGKEIMQFLSPEERLRGLNPEERVRGLTPEERMHGLNPEEVLRGLDSETQEELKKLLSEQAKKKNPK